MSSQAINGGSPVVWSIKENIEVTMMGIVNILFVVGAIYMMYMNRNSVMALAKSPVFWGFFVSSNYLMFGAFFITLIKRHQMEHLKGIEI